LIDNIKANLDKYPAKKKDNKGFGDVYEVILNLKGPNGKTAKVLTGDIYSERPYRFSWRKCYFIWVRLE
jgi:hypothetical protein